MSENSPIEWTRHTFNTHWGCNKVSPGCDNCYAQTLAARFGYGWGDGAAKREFAPSHWNDLLVWDRKAAAAGERHRVFTNSMSDFFDKLAPAGVRELHYSYIERTPNLEHLLLTKRIGNVRGMVPAAWLEPGGWPKNVRIGISLVDQKEANRDVHKLLALNCPNFLSIEPQLGPIDLRFCEYHTTGNEGDGNRWSLNLDALSGFRATSMCSGVHGKKIDWVIAGGESGHKARPAHPDWFRSLRDQCADAYTPFLFKQWGEWNPGNIQAASGAPAVCIQKSGATRPWPPAFDPASGSWCMHKVGKKAAGRLLDGVEHNGFPA
ncbi:MAG: phage Gp37/Gp68 family protein [Pseudomonadota bacterium]